MTTAFVNNRYLSAISSILCGMCRKKSKRYKNEIVQKAENDTAQSEVIDLMQLTEDASSIIDTYETVEGNAPEIFYSNNEDEEDEKEVVEEDEVYIFPFGDSTLRSKQIRM